MAESPASRQWLDCLTENSDAVGGSEGLMQSSMMSFHTSQQTVSDTNCQSLSDKTPKELNDISLITAPTFSMFSSDSDGSEAGDVHLPHLSLSEATLDDGLAKSEANVESNPDPFQPIEDIVQLVEQVKLEHPYAEIVDGKTDVTYYCPHKECVQVCNTQQEMVDHVRDQHSSIQASQIDDDIDLEPLPSSTPSSSVIGYKCTSSDCNVICSSYEQLVEHVKAHDSGQLHRCTIHNCTETFHTLADLREHMYSHRDKRIFTCRICEESFQFSYQLRKHMELHGEDDEDEQDLEAALKSNKPKLENIKSHTSISSHEDGTDTDPEHSMIQMSSDGKNHQFTCLQDDCGETFSSKRLLTEHSASHDNLLPYKCTTCGKAFKFSFLLNRHRKIHNGLMCSQGNCHQSFESARELKEHMKTHDLVQKRPRGRPRKKQIENTEPSQESKAEKSVPVKTPKQSTSAATVPSQTRRRPVGRPRKVQPQSVTEPSAEKQKTEVKHPSPDAKPKRPRGRPKLIKSSETDKKSSPEATPLEAATTPPRMSLSPSSSDALTPTRCSARSTKGQWRSSGSKTNMGGVALLSVIKQERTKFRRISTTDTKTESEDEHGKSPRKRLSSAEDGPEVPEIKIPKKSFVVHSTPKSDASSGNESSKELDFEEKPEKQMSRNGTKEPAGEVKKSASFGTQPPPKKVIRITTAKPIVRSAPRGRPPKSVLKVGHATQQTKKGPAINVMNEKDSDDTSKNISEADGKQAMPQGEPSTKVENTPADVTNNQANKSKKLQRNKASLMKTMSTRQTRGLTCVIPFCTSYQLNKGHNQTNVHFIKFPQQQTEINKWIKILKLPKDFEVKPSTRICHLHFNKNDLEINSDGFWQCRAGAAPRIFNAK